MRYLVPVGRFFYSAIFLMTALGHFSQQYIGYAAQQGVPAAGLLVPLSGVIATAGGLSVALGYQAKIGAWLLVLFLVPVTLMMHNFWAVTDPTMHGMQLAGKAVRLTGRTWSYGWESQLAVRAGRLGRPQSPTKGVYRSETETVARGCSEHLSPRG